VRHARAPPDVATLGEDDVVAGQQLARVHRRRAAVQGVTGPPAVSGGDVVRRLLAVQAQDAPMAAWSLALRMPPRTTYAGVLAEQGAGGWVRTHVLRPTWHLVALEASLGARHRQLGLDDVTLGRTVHALADLLDTDGAPTRRELTAAFSDRGLPASGEQVGHQLMVAELRGVICSGPPRGGEHSYALVDDVLPPGPLDALEGEAARTELVRRFMAGHGPATDRDLARWSTLTLTEVRAALGELGEALESMEVDGARMWFDPQLPSRTTRRPGALLVPTFDELTLTYAHHGFPRRDPTSPRPRVVNGIGGGTVLIGGEDVAVWRRRVTGAVVEVTVAPDAPLTTDEERAVEHAASALARFIGRRLELRVARPR
jgi:hypothetical protein